MEKYTVIKWWDTGKKGWHIGVGRLEDGAYVGPCDATYYQTVEDAQRGVEGYKERSKQASLV